MKLTIQQLKNTIKVAKHTRETEFFSSSIKNDFRDISIIITYYPKYDPKEDIYPYWEINMKEEEFCKKVTINGKDLRQVRDIYNSFISQGIRESYLENNLIGY